MRHRRRQREGSAPCNCTSLRKASRRVSQLYDAILAPCGLRTTQRAILNHISRAGTPSVGELAADLVLDRGALAHNLKPLERDGYVRQDVDPRDRRNRVIRLTEKGRAKLRESELLWARAQKKFEKAYGAAASVALRDALALVASDKFIARFAGAVTSSARVVGGS
jgi:DNA-binding MarR family transcriptional regulator